MKPTFPHFRGHPLPLAPAAHPPATTSSLGDSHSNLPQPAAQRLKPHRLEAVTAQTPPKRRTNNGHQNAKLLGVVSDKTVIGPLSKIHRELVGLNRNAPYTLGSDVLSRLSESNTIGEINLEAQGVREIFENGASLLARTLSRSIDPQAQSVPTPQGCSTLRDSPPSLLNSAISNSDSFRSVDPLRDGFPWGIDSVEQPWPTPSGMVAPGRVERDILNNRTLNLTIVLTPATILNKNLKISTISSHPGRPQWHHMPSVLYAAPTQGQSHLTDNLIDSKAVFGNVLSFSTKDGFTPEFLTMIEGGEHSHAQLINNFMAQPKIIDNLKVKKPFNKIVQTVPELLEQISKYSKQEAQQKKFGRPSKLYEDGSVPHNEVVTRLWLWDIKAIDVAKNVELGLTTAIELQIARKALCKELDQMQTEHPMFKDFVKQQLSLDVNHQARTIEETSSLFEGLTPDKKDEILQELRSRLESPVSLCRYDPQGPHIKSLEPNEVSGKVALSALKTVLSVRVRDVDASGNQNS